MAYSRWSHSIWYTFWSAAGPDNTFKLPTKKLKDKQVFEICDYSPFYVTYGELKKDFKSKVKEIEQFYSKQHTSKINQEIITWNAKNPTFEQMVEIRKYLLEFIADVDNHFKWNNFFSHEWYYPIKNKIFWKLMFWKWKSKIKFLYLKLKK